MYVQGAGGDDDHIHHEYIAPSQDKHSEAASPIEPSSGTNIRGRIEHTRSLVQGAGLERKYPWLVRCDPRHQHILTVDKSSASEYCDALRATLYLYIYTAAS